VGRWCTSAEPARGGMVGRWAGVLKSRQQKPALQGCRAAPPPLLRLLCFVPLFAWLSGLFIYLKLWAQNEEALAVSSR
jgi:hypothetical protein